MSQGKTTEELILVRIFFWGRGIVAWWAYDEFYKN
tara:strand:- start:294 stop:398 length:105 start_codon:yes stop_codon:yes gene_type:complete